MDDGGGHHQSGADGRLYGCVGVCMGGGEGQGFYQSGADQLLVQVCIYGWAVGSGGGRGEAWASPSTC